MQNKYVNTAFYLIVIVVITLCGMATLKRYQADAYFNLARNHVPSYVKENENLVVIQAAYWKAIDLNPLEFKNYAGKLNSDCLKGIIKRRKQ